MPSRTRARAAVADHQHRELIFASLASTDILSCLLPHLAFPAFLALRSTCTEVHAATNTACKDVAKVLRHAAELYVSPRFLEALRLVADHRRPLSWMLLTPALPVVYGEAYGDLVAAAYHLLQAHLTRVQKLRLSNLLRRAARQCIGPEHCEARCWLAHLAVRLGMFSECTQHLTELHDAARGALTDATAHFAAAAAPPPLVAAIHYTLAGFYTYHHRKSEDFSGEDGPHGHTLERANGHLNKALEIQSQQLGALHISTLCSHLVKAQVLLMRDNEDTSGQECKALLHDQLRLCEASLGANHPLGAKMLAVLARLSTRMGDDAQCDELQTRVLQLRRDALGAHHEDSHRSAMDVYSRRRQKVRRSIGDGDAVPAFSRAVETCLDMVTHAAADADSERAFCLSKSLQLMAEFLVQDVPSFAARGTWERATTLSYLTTTLEIATRLPLFPEEMEVILKDDWRSANRAPGAAAALTLATAEEMAKVTEVRNAANERRAEKANAIRQLMHGVEQAPSWPPPHGWQPPVNEA